jgi:hypothetical protein
VSTYPIPAERLVALVCRHLAYDRAASESRFPARVFAASDAWHASLTDAEAAALSGVELAIGECVSSIRADAVTRQEAA